MWKTFFNFCPSSSLEWLTMSKATNEQKETLLKLVKSAIEQDQALRSQFQIGDKFRFIRDRLQALLLRVEEGLAEMQKEEKVFFSKLADDEVTIYIYLYNSHGMTLKTWLKMLNPTVYYEYSINRPIYMDKAHIEQFIRNKPNKLQHAYLEVAVKKASILPTRDELLQDPVGHPLIKVKEGALSADKLIAFVHNNIEYVLDEEEELIKRFNEV